jgi:osmotically-inducible protein OsmY
VVVSSGVLFFAQSVKLPFSVVTEWDEGCVDIDAVSFHAFAREVPPVPIPTKPLSTGSPISHPGTRFAGLLMNRNSRTVTEILIAKGRGWYRVAVPEARVEGNTINLIRDFKTLPRYFADSTLEARLHDAVAEDSALTTDDKSSLTLNVESGVAIVRGNVRVEPTRAHVRTLAAGVPGIVSVREEAVDDITLETSIGLALDRTGLQRRAKVFARSNLGRITLYGSAASGQLADDVVREVTRVPGVRQVNSRLALNPA